MTDGKPRSNLLARRTEGNWQLAIAGSLPSFVEVDKRGRKAECSVRTGIQTRVHLDRGRLFFLSARDFPFFVNMQKSSKSEKKREKLFALLFRKLLEKIHHVFIRNLVSGKILQSFHEWWLFPDDAH